MTRKALMEKCQNLKQAFQNAKVQGKAPKFPTRVYNRCSVCGRPHGYMRKFDMCRICVREKANAGEILGVRKSSW